MDEKFNKIMLKSTERVKSHSSRDSAEYSYDKRVYKKQFFDDNG